MTDAPSILDARTIRDAFAAAGIAPGDTVIVHISLRRLGYVARGRRRSCARRWAPWARTGPLWGQPEGAVACASGCGASVQHAPARQRQGGAEGLAIAALERQHARVQLHQAARQRQP